MEDKGDSWFKMRTGRYYLWPYFHVNAYNYFQHMCFSVAGIPMELIIIAIIGIVLIISICICVCILGQTLIAKRRQPNPNQPHFNTDTIDTQPTQYGDGGHTMTSSWMCSYPGEKPTTTHIWETPLPVPCADKSEGEYTLPASMRHAQDKAEPALSENMQTASQMLTSTVSDGEYTAPVTMNVDDQQHAAVVPPQPMPEYTLPIKKEIRESPAHDTGAPSPEDYLQPIAVRPEPVGAHDVPQPSVFEGSSLKNAGYRPESVMVDSVVTEDAEDYINADAESSYDALLQGTK